mmetsp:Transcript_45665/g.148437  ORF Transcript_45665/g.148437 Transcript_45665/m.148437 type:complete len:253 (-) Transcript_45665:283-1041(-)
MWCSAQDVAATFAGLSLWLAAVRASGHLASASLTVAPTPAFVLTALSVSSSYIVYSLVWFNAARFAAACQRAPLGLLGVDAVGVFQTLVLAFKLGQQLALLLWAAHAAGADVSSPHAVVHALATLLESFCADRGRLAVAAVLMGVGQTLNAGIYAAIGRNGVYYGFKLGAPVPWCSGFPFNLGFRHPQYVGGTLSQYAVFLALSSPATSRAGLLPLLAWWSVNYAAMSWVEASFGDNDGSEEEAPPSRRKAA